MVNQRVKPLTSIVSPTNHIVQEEAVKLTQTQLVKSFIAF